MCKSISEPSKSLSKRPRRDPSAGTFPKVSHNIFGAGVFLVWFFFYHRYFNILGWKWEYLWDFWHWQHSVSPRKQQALSTGSQIMTFQERAMTPELPNAAIQKSLQWARGRHSWALFPPWHFISWVWVAPDKKKELHPSSIYHPQTLTDLARGAVIQYTEGGLKIVTLWLSCFHCVSKHWQPQSSHLGHLKTSCAAGIVCPHTKTMKVSWAWRQWGQKKDNLAQNPDCTDGYWTKPLLPTLCIAALKTDELRRQEERAAQHKFSSITVLQGIIKWIEKSSNIQRDCSTSTVCNQYVCSGIKQTSIINTEGMLDWVSYTWAIDQEIIYPCASLAP